MLYILMPFTDEAAWFKQTRAEQEQGSAAYGEYGKALAEAGVLVGNYRPHPSSAAKTVRSVDGKIDVQQGPVAATKEQLGGIDIIEVPDLDTALAWAARNPAVAYGVVEVRRSGVLVFRFAVRRRRLRS